MTSRFVALGLDAVAPSGLATFWAGLLGRDCQQDSDGVSVPGPSTQIDLRFVASGAAKLGPNRVHLHLTSASEDDQQRRVAAALQLGARHLDVGQRPDEGHIVLADPEGNEFCIIEAGNAYLAGCGVLGELACDGTRAVGLFWAKALGWPLVWDQDEETAVQSPDGGTKVAWGGPSVRPWAGGRGQRFLLESSGEDPWAEVERLVSLGASRLDLAAQGGVGLADPDGNEFVIRLE